MTQDDRCPRCGKDLLVHGSHAVDDEGGIHCVDGLTDWRLDHRGILRGAGVDSYSKRVGELWVGAVDGHVHVGAQVLMFDIAYDTDDGCVGRNWVISTFGDHAAECVLRGAVETLGKGEVDDGYLGSIVRVRGGKVSEGAWR